MVDLGRNDTVLFLFNVLFCANPHFRQYRLFAHTEPKTYVNKRRKRKTVNQWACNQVDERVIQVLIKTGN